MRVGYQYVEVFQVAAALVGEGVSRIRTGQLVSSGN